MRFAVRTVKHVLRALGYGLVGSAVVLVALYLRYLQSRPDLDVWHTVDLSEEFTAQRLDQVPDLAAYRRLEDRLFRQLDDEVTSPVSARPGLALSRYVRAGPSDPERFGSRWNRTFELPVEKPRAGMLLLHGLSDSPYSMRALAMLAQEQGILAVGLRVPGHGTAPAGLVKATWEDFVAATRLGARYVRERIGPERPFYIAGYSNGAALAVEYSLAVLEGEPYPAADGLILLSPAIGVSKIAALAVWQARIGSLLGLDKVAWNSIGPEYDPFKYNSFAVNAGDQIHRLTGVIAKRMQRLNDGEGVRGFPRVLAFQSVVDSTIPPATLMDRLFRQLAPEGHELVLFDINRLAEATDLLVSNPESLTRALTGDDSLPFAVTLVTNSHDDSHAIVALHKEQQRADVAKEPLGLRWPRGVISLSHVAIPFPPDDPLYGRKPTGDPDVVHLGALEVRGEQGLLAIPPGQILRLRHNPFWPYLESRVRDFLR